MRHSLLVLMLGWILLAATTRSAVAAPPVPSSAHDIARIEQHLNRAGTWYRWARATQNSVVKHRAAAAEYQKAKELAQALPPGEQRLHLLGAASAGLEQSKGRIENAFDTFRNVYSPVWWILEQDETLETYDDEYMRALLNAWKPLAERILGPFRAGFYWVIPRCQHPRLNREAPAKAAAFCTVFRDELLGHADTNPRFISMTDDRGHEILGEDWDRLIRAADLPRGPLVALARSTGAQRIVVVDLKVADEMGTHEAPLGAVRVDISARIWDAHKQEAADTLVSTGVSATVIPRRKLVAVWLGGLLLVAILIPVLGCLVRSRSSKRLGPGRATAGGPIAEQAPNDRAPSLIRALGLQAVLGALAYLVGAALAYGAGKFSGSFIPDWMDMALGPGGGPRLEVMLWPLVHGAVVLVGPIAASGYLSLRVLGRYTSRSDLKLDVQVVIPSAQAGAVAWLFAPLVLSLPGEGIQIAASLSVAGLLISLATARALARFLDPAVGVTKASAGIGLGLLGLLLLLPLGFFNGHHLLIAGIFSGLAAPIWFLSSVNCGAPSSASARRIGRDRLEPPVGLVDLSRPGFVVRKDRSLSVCVDWLEEGGLRTLVISGPKGVGKSRFVDELVGMLQDKAQQQMKSRGDWRVGHACCEKPPAGADDERPMSNEPYQLVSDALQGVLSIGPLTVRHERLTQAQLLADGVGKILDGLPGFGALPGAEVGEGVTRDMLARHIVERLREGLENEPILLVFDDIQWADQSSLELLSHVLHSLRNGRDRVGPAVNLGILIITRPEGIVRLGETLPDRGSQKAADPLLFAPRQITVPVGQDLNESTCEGQEGRDILSLALGPLGEEQVEKLLVNMSLELGDFPDGFCRTVCDICQGDPFGTISFIRSLLEAGYLSQNMQGRLRPAATAAALTKQVLLDAVPPKIMANQLARLERLPEDDLLLLECAALCGRTFAITDVSEGLGRPRLEVIRCLQRIEDMTGFIMDGDQHDGHFEFSSEITREVLLRRMKKKHGSSSPELVKEMHARMAQHLIQQGDLVFPGRVALHCARAGQRLAWECISYSVEAARQAVRLCAWSEALKHVARGREAMEAPELSTAGEAGRRHAMSADLLYLEACVLRGRGAKGDPEKALEHFRKLVSGDGVPPYEWVYAYLECAYSRVQEACYEEIIRQADRWLTEEDWGAFLVPSLVEFYRLLSRAKLKKEVAPLPGLRKVHAVVAATPCEPDEQRKRDLLLSYITQEMGIALSTNKGATRDEVEALFDASRALKERHGDLQGLAINYGSRGSYYLRTLKDPAMAREWFQRDLDLVSAMGDEGILSLIYNQLGSCDWMEAVEQGDAGTREDLQRRALRNAQKALKLGYTPNNKAFAAMSVLRYAEVLGEEGIICNTGQILDDPEFWEELDNKGLRKQVYEAVQKIAKQLGEERWRGVQREDWPWVSNILIKFRPR